jgi:IPT/TIG domain/PASTA domain
MLVIVTAIAAMLLGAASAQASRITIGSPMDGTFAPSTCDEPCTVVTVGSTDPEAVVTSPVNGAIVAWRLEGGSPGYQYSLRVVTPGEPGIFTGAGTSAAVAPVGAGLETFSTDLPVKAGQEIGIDLPAEGPIDFNGAVGKYAFFAPPLADGQTADTLEIAGEGAFNAEILPAPTIGSLGAISGPTAGGTSVVIAGSNFADVKGVFFGSTAASYGVDSEGQITATAPPGTAGEVPVTVTTIAGTATAPQKFNYTAPAATITSAPPACKAPKLEGKKLKAAKKATKAAHCKLGHVVKKKGVTAKTGRVVKQRPKAGTARSVGAKVGVTLG